jgi:hypothetical protein
MSTTFPLHQSEYIDLEITESSARFDISMESMDFELLLSALTPDEALRIASRMIYAVWCSYPEEADAAVAELAKDIPNYQNKE